MTLLRTVIVHSVLIANAFPTSAGADLSELEVFKRCFIRFVRQVPDHNHELHKAVASGKLTGAAACMSLYDEAAIDDDGYLKNRKSAEARRILKTFHDLHRSWFQSRVNLQFKAMSYVVHDGEEDALYYTQAAFKKSIPYKSVVTANYGLQGRRDRIIGGDVGNYFQAQNLTSYNPSFPYGKSTDAVISYADPTLKAPDRYAAYTLPGDKIVQVGELVGVAPALKIKLPHFTGIQRLARSFPNYKDPAAAASAVNAAAKSNSANFDITAHYGSGILGSQTFMLNNANLALSELEIGEPSAKYPSEGGEVMINRRLSNRFFEDVLCHELPTLTAADVKSQVFPDSELAFRHDTSCMQCHAQNDGAAKTFRNLYVTMTATGTFPTMNVGLPVIAMGSLPVVSRTAPFPLQPPEGRLYYRQMLTNELVDKPLKSVADIGSIVATHDDIYRCAAKRYYAFLTGVDVSLSSSATKAVDKTHQTFVLQIADKLKSDQSVRLLVQRIVQSQAFRTFNYNSEVP